jgi:hypothetical protein
MGRGRRGRWVAWGASWECSGYGRPATPSESANWHRTPRGLSTAGSRRVRSPCPPSRVPPLPSAYHARTNSSSGVPVGKLRTMCQFDGGEVLIRCTARSCSRRLAWLFTLGSGVYGCLVGGCIESRVIDMV